jgi:hypothetical protein
MPVKLLAAAGLSVFVLLTAGEALAQSEQAAMAHARNAARKLAQAEARAQRAGDATAPAPAGGVHAPEPLTVLVAGAGLAGALLLRKRRR